MVTSEVHLLPAEIRLTASFPRIHSHGDNYSKDNLSPNFKHEFEVATYKISLVF
jgi:hypothetical protein